MCAQYGLKAAGEEQAVEGGFADGRLAPAFNESLVGRLGDGRNRAGLPAVLSQVGEVLQHAVFAAGVGFPVEQEKQHSHRAAASI
jgi:hypothetical protein